MKSNLTVQGKADTSDIDISGILNIKHGKIKVDTGASVDISSNVNIEQKLTVGTGQLVTNIENNSINIP